MSDLISRQAAIDEIDEWIKAFRENGHKESVADACLIQDGIIQLPSAQERKGKWVVEYGSDFKTYKVSRCSECGFEYGTVANLFKFCPYCGASMTEGAEDE